MEESRPPPDPLMGQQQLLLLVLGIVIVGLAVVVGLQAFNENRRKSDMDQAQNEALRLAMAAVAWRQSPTTTGGGAADATFARLSLAAIGYDNVTTAGDGEFAVSGSTIHSLWQRTAATSHVAVFNVDFTVQGAVFLYGPSEKCLAMRTGRLLPDETWEYSPAETPPMPAGCMW